MLASPCDLACAQTYQELLDRVRSSPDAVVRWTWTDRGRTHGKDDWSVSFNYVGDVEVELGATSTRLAMNESQRTSSRTERGSRRIGSGGFGRLMDVLSSKGVLAFKHNPDGPFYEIGVMGSLRFEVGKRSACLGVMDENIVRSMLSIALGDPPNAPELRVRQLLRALIERK